MLSSRIVYILCPINVKKPTLEHKHEIYKNSIKLRFFFIVFKICVELN